MTTKDYSEEEEDYYGQVPTGAGIHFFMTGQGIINRG
ncbi:hypothetical protein BHECKSOX_585 [Bathymodiolus heckerae thiotrophic gill symbiont]|nr:hypothetical protein BHECKSOX_585 [Bathymodiolus heckerae thiotrophic gill symbiont]